MRKNDTNVTKIASSPAKTTLPHQFSALNLFLDLKIFSKSRTFDHLVGSMIFFSLKKGAHAQFIRREYVCVTQTWFIVGR